MMAVKCTVVENVPCNIFSWILIGPRWCRLMECRCIGGGVGGVNW